MKVFAKVGIVAVLLVAAPALSGCSGQGPAAPEVASAVDAYADALAGAFVKPIVEGGTLQPLVVNYKERELVARANTLVGPYQAKWETSSAKVSGLLCSGGGDAVDCSYLAVVGVSAPNETANVNFQHKTRLIRRGDGPWLVETDEIETP